MTAPLNHRLLEQEIQNYIKERDRRIAQKIKGIKNEFTEKLNQQQKELSQKVDKAIYEATLKSGVFTLSGACLGAGVGAGVGIGAGAKIGGTIGIVGGPVGVIVGAAIGGGLGLAVAFFTNKKMPVNVNQKTEEKKASENSIPMQIISSGQKKKTPQPENMFAINLNLGDE